LPNAPALQPGRQRPSQAGLPAGPLRRRHAPTGAAASLFFSAGFAAGKSQTKTKSERPASRRSGSGFFHVQVFEPKNRRSKNRGGSRGRRPAWRILDVNKYRTLTGVLKADCGRSAPPPPHTPPPHSSTPSSLRSENASAPPQHSSPYRSERRMSTGGGGGGAEFCCARIRRGEG
jgi:hypothetical protein